jgi:hypothetical protein
MFCSYVTPLYNTNDFLPTHLQIFWAIFWIAICTIKSLLAFPCLAVLLMGLVPVVSAAPNQDAISNITFQAFAEFVEQNYSSTVSLATVLVTLFTVTDNSDLLNLHSRMQNPQLNERYHAISGWIKALARALNEKLGQNTSELFEEPEEISELDNDRLNHEVAIKLDALYKLLNMSPYDNQGNR